MQGLIAVRQEEEVAAVLEAVNKEGYPLYREVVVMIPRRAGKTTSIWNVLLGRCDSRPNYKVVVTAQDGTRARNRLRDVLRALDAKDFTGEKNPANRRGRLRWANGDEGIEWDNGSRIWCVPPSPAALRGEAADVMFFDEAGELSEDTSEKLLAGALPIMDTRLNGQVIIAGTPGETRSGLLWDKFSEALMPKSKVGILSYNVEDHETVFTYDEEGTPSLVSNVLRRVHPGIGTLTTFDIVSSRLRSMPPALFEREYLCRFPFDSATTALSSKLWDKARAAEGLPPRPDKIGLSFDVSPDGTTASIAAAWRDDAGKAHVEIIACEYGTAWVTKVCQQAYKKYRSAFAYDSIGANTDVADQLRRMKIPLAPMQIRQMQGAAARFAQQLESENLIHYSQKDLDTAVAGAAWRNVNENGRLFARKASASDVTPLVAASEALWQYDQQAKKRVSKGIFV